MIVVKNVTKKFGQKVALEESKKLLDRKRNVR